MVTNPRHAAGERSDRASLFKLRKRDQSEARPKQKPGQGATNERANRALYHRSTAQPAGQREARLGARSAGTSRLRETEGTLGRDDLGLERTGGGPTVAAPLEAGQP